MCARTVFQDQWEEEDAPSFRPATTPHEFRRNDDDPRPKTNHQYARRPHTSSEGTQEGMVVSPFQQARNESFAGLASVSRKGLVGYKRNVAAGGKNTDEVISTVFQKDGKWGPDHDDDGADSGNQIRVWDTIEERENTKSVGLPSAATPEATKKTISFIDARSLDVNQINKSLLITEEDSILLNANTIDDYGGKYITAANGAPDPQAKFFKHHRQHMMVNDWRQEFEAITSRANHELAEVLLNRRMDRRVVYTSPALFDEAMNEGLLSSTKVRLNRHRTRDPEDNVWKRARDDIIYAIPGHIDTRLAFFKRFTAFLHDYTALGGGDEDDIFDASAINILERLLDDESRPVDVALFDTFLEALGKISPHDRVALQALEFTGFYVGVDMNEFPRLLVERGAISPRKEYTSVEEWLDLYNLLDKDREAVIETYCS